MTLRFALLGDPVHHSISPAVHRAAFEALGLDAEYVARRTLPGEVGSAMRSVELAGGNVTLPHKLRAARVLTEPSAAVRATGACNCWWRRADGRLAGDNTDVGGFRIALSRLGFEPRGARVLLLGAGGAARAAVHALVESGAATVEILNRTRARAEALEEAAVAHAPQLAGTVRAIRAPDPGATYDLAINSTSLGLSPEDALPLDLGGGAGPGQFRAVFDMVYAPGGTAWVRRARALGLPARSGLDMLAAQAALSVERWFPEHAAPFDAMRAAAEAALGARLEADEGEGASSA